LFIRFFVWLSVSFYLVLFATGCGASQKAEKAKADFDVIVVGAGLGGLSAAVHLANAGMKVMVLEQHYHVGGCASTFERGEFKFDVALHEMTVGGGNGFVIDLLKKVGVYDKVELIRIPELGRSIYPGVDFVHAGSLKQTVADLIEEWPEEKDGIVRYHELMVALAEEVSELRDIFLADPLTAAFKKFAVPFRQRTLFKYRNATLREVLDEYFVDERLKAVIAQFWIYNGPPPKKLWAIMHLLASHAYMETGAWHIKGSSNALAIAYRDRILELGGEVRTETRVTAITVEKKRATGVVIDTGETFSARYVISNADPYQTFFELVGEDKTPRKLIKQIKAMQPSNSFAGVYLGLDVEPSFWGITDYEVAINTSLDIDDMHANMMAGHYEKGLVTLTFYGNLGDPFYAPEGKSVLVLNAYSDIANWPPRGEAYRKQKEEMVEKLLDIAETFLPDLRDHIVLKEGMTPRTIEFFTMNHHGIPYGWNVTPGQSERLPIKTPIEGLYMAGAWSWPSHSMGMTQVSGYLAARLITKEEGLTE
jgi:phytoene dehydrogenase-like protein